ncbi:DUF2793 domain-containing protein [Aureimonas sp. AU12]|uniref:DUF2793 domain-containing protein n=1 Tax=Aureimonas sp. AU12 TaxID=1638161 RepID=UPI000782B497|nr:DUF2793 domain-containing protein [Aureimonas sp. AU12]
MSQSSRLRFPYLMPQQAQKHLTHNEALRLLDVLVQTAVVSADRTDEPESAAEGDLFILPAGRSGARWATMAEGALALCENGAFVEIEPTEGQIAYVRDRKVLLVYTQGAWTGEPFAPRPSASFAVNAEPSSTNRLTVAADAELLTHDARTPGTGDARKIINKAAPGRTAAVLFQTGFSGRAEFGLVGNDDFSLRVSADGASFRDAMRIGASDGRVAVARAGAAVCALDVGGPVRVGTFAKAALPAAAAGAGQIVFVPDEAGGAVLAFSDGAAWRRVTDRAVVA